MEVTVRVMVGVALCLLAGCLGEGGARIRGRIESSGKPISRCHLNLYSPDLDRVLLTRNIGVRFNETFVIAPGEADYYVTITCDGIAGRYRSGRLKLGSIKKYRTGEDLGEIQLTEDGDR